MANIFSNIRETIERVPELISGAVSRISDIDSGFIIRETTEFLDEFGRKISTGFERLKGGEEVFKIGETTEPIIGDVDFRGDPESKVALVANTALGLPRAVFETLPFTRLLTKPTPVEFEDRLQAIGNETIDFIRGIVGLVAQQGISVVSLLKDEPIEDQIKSIPFLGEIPTVERQAFELLINEASPVEVGITLAAQAAVTAGLLGAPAKLAIDALRPQIVTRRVTTALSFSDVRDITSGRPISAPKLDAFKQAVSEGVSIGQDD